MPPIPLVRWQFYDGSTDETYELEINPKDDVTPIPKKNFTYQGTTAPDGETIIYEGAMSPARRDISGTILEQTHLEAMIDWYLKDHQFKVTDDLGREGWYIFETFEAKRGWKYQSPWRHTFSATLVVVVAPD